MTDYILSIDPGKRQTGCALWDQGTKRLVRAGLARNLIQTGGDDLDVCAEMARGVKRWLDPLMMMGDKRIVLVAAERPQVYHESKQVKEGHRTDPNDLPPLMGVDVGVLCLTPGARGRSYLPREWKGTLGKGVANQRALDRLTSEERACIDPSVPASLLHNVLDGIGIGLHHLGRGFTGEQRVRIYHR